uniref:CSON013128 protein n=1 Tax=Culicoides sonorensis TaxID=179676 RepID=A0A336KNZ6_CULSO
MHIPFPSLGEPFKGLKGFTAFSSPVPTPAPIAIPIAIGLNTPEKKPRLPGFDANSLEMNPDLIKLTS